MIDVISLERDGKNLEKLTLDSEEIKFDKDSLKTLSVIDCNNNLKKYNKLLKQIPKTRKNIEQIKHIKDTIIHSLIDKIKPPYYLRVEDINYRAIVTHFLFKFTNKSRIILSLSDFLYDDINPEYKKSLEKIFCGKNNTITIMTNIENIFHLMDFKKDSKTSEYLGDILYDKLKIHDTRHLKDTITSFKAKIASLPWLIDTLKKPDLIYDKNADLTKNINPDLVFVRNTGDGSNKEKYMHHYIALIQHKDKSGIAKNPSIYTILSQFALEKHTSSQLSYLYKKVKINGEIYKRG
jgi:hypothetical protein